MPSFARLRAGLVGFALVGCGDRTVPQGDTDAIADTSGGASESETDLGSDEGTDGSGGADVVACRGDVPGGGEAPPIVGTGATVTGQVFPESALMLEDQGASLIVTITDPAGVLPPDATVSITSVAEPTPSSPFALGPVFSLELHGVPEGTAFFAKVTGTADPDRIGDCDAGLRSEGPSGGWSEWSTDVEQPLYGDTRFLMASRCSSLTCGGSCADETSEAHCGGCGMACDGVCVSPGTCEGLTLGPGRAAPMRSDGTLAAWIEEDLGSGAVGGIFAVTPPDDPVSIAASDPEWTIAGLDVAEGIVYWLERAGDRWAVRSSPPGGAVVTLADIDEPGRPAFRLAAGDEAVVVMRTEPGVGSIPWRVPFAGGPPEPVPDPFEAPLEEWAVSAVRVFGGRVFATVVDLDVNETIVRSCDLAGGSHEEVLVSATEGIEAGPPYLEVDDAFVYVAAPGASAYRASRDGGGATDIGRPDAQYGDAGFLVRDGSVYFGGFDAGARIVRVGPDLRVETIVDNENAVGLGWANGWLVWSTGQSSSIRAIMP